MFHFFMIIKHVTVWVWTVGRIVPLGNCDGTFSHILKIIQLF